MLYSCCGLNSLVDEHKEFEKSRNSEIGGSIEIHLPTYVQIIKEWDGIYGEAVQVIRNENGTVTFIEPIDTRGDCMISRVIETNTWTIMSWEYFEGKNNCREARFICTA